MVNLILMITAELDELTDLQPQGGCDDANFPFYFKIKCGNCGEISPKETCLVAAPKSRGTTNLVQKCKFCGREGNIAMIPGKGRPLTTEDGETEGYAPLMLFDSRGIKPVEFAFGDGWKMQSTDGTKFEGIDLSSGEYSEYCEKGQAPVMIFNLKSKFEVLE
ncbi:hypothetical protein MKW94_024335 [Papaver nudicaule]|uniref:Uncharacterized protein n=1 Tax=Papaver nudicaule TaxID=74823 RepID=A0AA42AUY8_PAPNU|nr:hypothetical protein [Papaver nudicaule]